MYSLGPEEPTPFTPDTETERVRAGGSRGLGACAHAVSTVASMHEHTSALLSGAAGGDPRAEEPSHLSAPWPSEAPASASS